MPRMNNAYKISLALAALAVVCFSVAYAVRKTQTVDPLTAQIEAEEKARNEEIDMLVQRIQSGSTLWQQAAKREKVWHDEKVRQEQGTAGYRLTLCTKFGRVVDASGSVVLIDDPLFGTPDTSKCANLFL